MWLRVSAVFQHSLQVPDVDSIHVDPGVVNSFGAFPRQLAQQDFVFWRLVRWQAHPFPDGVAFVVGRVVPGVGVRFAGVFCLSARLVVPVPQAVWIHVVWQTFQNAPVIAAFQFLRLGSPAALLRAK